ncbi:MAG: hypothetical protein WCC60_08030 [Ilumatobacteraceae bacterium]
MFTTGSKLFFGATALSIVASIVFALSNGGPTGVMGTVGLLSLAVVFAFLAGINYFIHDGNVPSMEQGVEYTSAAAQPPVTASGWPLVAAVGAAGLIVGAVSKPVVFKVAVVVVLAAAIEWMVLGWSERASGSHSYNADVRRRLLNPLEFPIVGAIGLGGVVYAFSRVMLHVNKDAGRWIFIVVGALILGGGFLFASRRGVGKGTVAGLCTISAVALLGVGVASAVKGQRPIEEHPTTAGSALCLEGGSESEIDGHAAQDVSAKSSLLANIFLQSNDIVIARVNGIPDQAFSEITVPRSAAVRIMFHNDSKSPQRLTARLGTFGTAGEVVMCTQAVNPGKEAFLDFKIPKTEAASTTPFVLLVPGLPGQEIQIVVP